MPDASMIKLMDAVGNLEKDMAQIGVLVDRLDITIDKLSEVSSNVSQLLAVQGSRLEIQEKLINQLSAVMERRRQENEMSIKDLHNKFDEANQKTLKDVDSKYNDVKIKIENSNADISKKISNLSTRVGRLEKWMWALIGGAIVLEFIFNKIDISKLF